MVRLLIGLAVLVVVGTVYTVIDCALREPSRIRGLSKPVWLVVILLLPVAGCILWYILGRGREKAQVASPDNDPAFLNDLRRESEQDRRIRLLEEELAALDSESEFPDGDASPGGKPPRDPEDGPASSAHDR